MTLSSVELYKRFKTHYCQQQCLNLKTVMAPSMKIEKNPHYRQ